MSNSFIPPDIWNFPPFFTLQPNNETRSKQLDQWAQLILKHHSINNIYKMTPSSYIYFSNDSINRKLSNEGIISVINYLISKGYAEWEDHTNTTLKIYWRSPDSMADELYDWVVNNGFTNNVLTVYELHSSEDHINSTLYGVDILIVRKVLNILEKKGKCKIIPGLTPEEDGVKFLAV
eukprot:gene17233-22759_t